MSTWNNNEIVKDGVNGFLFEKDNVKELSERMKKLLTNMELREKLERNAQEEYVKKYDYRLFLEGYNLAYKNVI